MTRSFMTILFFVALSGCALPPTQKAASTEEYCVGALELAHSVWFKKGAGIPRSAIYFVPQTDLPQKELDRIEQVIDWVYEGTTPEDAERRCLTEWKR